MTKPKNIEYKNGMKFVNGPPMRSGSYKNWNWCKSCTTIWEKKMVRCGDCNQITRSTAKSRKANPSNSRTRKEREAYRARVLRDLREWESKR